MCYNFKHVSIREDKVPMLMRATRKMNIARATEWLRQKRLDAIAKRLPLTHVTITDAMNVLEITEAEIKGLIKLKTFSLGLTSQGIRVIPVQEFADFLNNLQ